MRETRAGAREVPAPLEARRATSVHSFPRGRSEVNGPAFIDEQGLGGASPRSGRPHSVANLDTRPARGFPVSGNSVPPDRDSIHPPPRGSADERGGVFRPYRFTDDFRRSLPARSVDHVTAPSAEWIRDRQNAAGPQLDQERGRSLSSDGRKFFPPLQQDRSIQRNDRERQLENTRREV